MPPPRLTLLCAHIPLALLNAIAESAILSPCPAATIPTTHPIPAWHQAGSSVTSCLDAAHHRQPPPLCPHPSLPLGSHFREQKLPLETGTGFFPSLLSISLFLILFPHFEASACLRLARLPTIPHCGLRASWEPTCLPDGTHLPSPGVLGLWIAPSGHALAWYL